jgi:hypothetical protein
MLPNITHAHLPDAGQVPHSDLDLRPPALWRHIYHTTLASAAATIDLGNLPTGFERWQLAIHAISDAAAEADSFTVTFNDDTAAHYDEIVIAHDYPLTQLVTVNRAASALTAGFAEAADSRANTAAPNRITIHRPTQTTTETTGHTEATRFGDRSADADLVYQLTAFAWRSTAAIAKITLTMATGNFAPHTTIALWGFALA